jgi:cytochrome c oxidase subunit 2
MTGHHRARWARFAALAPLLALALAACDQHVPNTIFGAHSEFGHDVDNLTRGLLYAGIAVFVLVETALIFAVFKFRQRPGNTKAVQTHGNTTLEITWTFIPAVILAFIAVPTVQTIFRTQAAAPADALQVEVIGHQWWWEFRYPQYNVVTANELYLPVGRTVNFSLKTNDVLHSFWIPQLNGKRDLISNHVNHLWFTPDSIGAYNGFCAEFCGASHANMRFKAFAVSKEQFADYIAHQQTGPVFPAPVDTTHPAPAKGGKGVIAAAPMAPVPAAANAATTTTGTWPLDKLPVWIVPATPLPAVLGDTMPGDAARGAAIFKTAPCIACHTVKGVSPGVIGPNLTHIGSRTTIASGLYPNDHAHLVAWIKDAPMMKPGSAMMALGAGFTPAGGLTDQQIADIAAYLSALK